MVMPTPNYTHRLERLLEVCRICSANREWDAALRSVVALGSELTESQDISILVHDPISGHLRFIAAQDTSIGTLRSIGVPLDRSVAGWVFSNRQALSLHPDDANEQIYRVVDRELHNLTQSLLAVPMYFHGEPVGVIEAINKANNAHYTAEDQTILETLAAQMALFVQNRRLLDEVEQGYRRMVELERMKDDFIAIISHELRTPLGLVLGHAALLAETADPDQRTDLEVILRNAQRLREIVEEFSNADLLQSKLAQMRLSRVDVPALIHQVVAAYQSLAAARKIRLAVKATQPNLWVECDAEKIAVALNNLVKNALTFTNEGGVVLVRARKLRGCVQISVVDSGVGIPSEELERIFQRFYQVEKHLTRRHGGMGMGLSVARDMVEMHGGRIWVESVEGKGSKFTFTLPLRDEPFSEV